MKKILAIDDQIDNLITIKAVINSRIPNCDVLTALSGQDGIDIAIKEQPDAILLDIIMPRMDGYETCKKLKENELTKHIPLVMVTAIKTDSESRVRGLNMGADAFLSKPIDAVELTAQINVMLRIKEAEDKLRAEKDLLEELVADRTRELIESEQKYKTLYDFAPIPYQSLKEDGSINDVNPEWLKMLGYNREEVIGELYENYIHPDDRAVLKKNFPVLKEIGQVHEVPFRLRHKDGHYFDIALEGCSGYNPDGSFKQTYCVFQDITERKKTETENRKLSTAVEQSPTVIAITDLDRNLEYVNPKFTEVTGYTSEEVIGKNPRILKSGEQDNTIYKKMWETVSRGKEWRGEFHNKKKNGKLFWESVSLSPIFDKQGKISNYIKVSEDITERKKAEEILLKLNIAINNAKEVIFMTDKEGIISYINPEFTKIYGYTADEIIGKTTPRILKSGFFSDEQNEYVWKTLLTKQSIPVASYINKRKDGTNIDVEGSIDPILDNQGNLMGYLAIQRDITERKQNEKAFRASEERLKIIFESAPDAYFLMDTKGTLLDGNTAAEKLINYKKEELIGKNILKLNLLSIKELSKAVQTLAKSVMGKKTGPDEFLLNRKDGSKVPVEIISYPVKINNKTVILGIARDITERKRIDEEMSQQRQRLAHVLEGTNAGTWDWQVQSDTFVINDRWAEIMGYSLDELKPIDANTWINNVHADDMPIVNSLLDKVFSKKLDYFDVEFRQPHKNGKWIWVNARGKVIEWAEDGKPLRMSGTHIDITERKRAEQIQEVIYNISKAANSSIDFSELIEIIRFELGKLIETTNLYIAFLDEKSGTLTSSSVKFDEEDKITTWPAEKSATGYVIKHQKSLLANEEKIRKLAAAGEIEIIGTLSKIWLGVPLKADNKVIGAVVVQSYNNPNAYTEDDKLLLEFISDQISISIHRKKTNDLLRESEERYRSLVENLPVGIFQSTIEGQLVSANPAMAEMYGYDSVDELLQVPAEKYYSKKNPREKMLTALKKKGYLLEYETLENKKDGSPIWISANYRASFDANGNIDSIEGVIIDITNRKYAHELLKKSEERFDLAMKASNDGLYDWDLVTNEVYYSARWKSILGYTDHELPNDISIWESLSHQEEKEKSLLKLQDAVERKIEHYNVEFRMKHKLGHWVNILSRAQIIYNKEGKAIRVVGTHSDLTEEKEAEQNLVDALKKAEESESLLRLKNEELNNKNAFIQTILDNLPIGLALNNFDGGDATYMNKKFEDIYGWSSDEIISIESFFNKVYPDEEYRNQLVERVMTDINSGDPERLHWENIFITRKDGSKGIVNTVNISLAEQNTMVSTVMDITDLYEIQIDLVKAKEKAEESDRLKSAFLANMSHEIRTPMNGILGFADLLKQPDLSGDEQQSYIDVIERAGKRMLNIINDLVNISRIESGQADIVISEVNINKQTEYLYTFFKPETEIKGLNLSIKNSLPDSKAIIQSDNEKIYAVLTNLIKNAIKYSPQGSIEFGYELKGKFIEFFVKDDGIGIEKDKQKAVFERFVQADLSLSSKYEGAGLGLAISKAYVEMLGGKIWVESTFGQGSLFSFTIPYSPIPDKASKGKEEDPKSIIDTFNKKINILIAEDDETSSFFLKTMIKSIYKEMLLAKTGIEAIEICKTKKDIDLVFMDIKMPEMDGYEATRKIRKFNKDVIIVAQTAYALPGDREKALEAGCNDYVPKPISKKNLFKIIGKYFEK